METRQREIPVRWESLTLQGTLFLPQSEGPHPIVLMMQGSGPADRDCDGYFPDIREAFLVRGIATFAFDKPGCGSSTGNWLDYALEGRTSQALAVLECLRSDPDIDADRVGVWGQSQGGWLVQMVAAREPDLRFAIANSGPSISPNEQDLYGCEHTMRSQGHDETDIELGVELIKQLHRAANRGADYETVDAEVLRGARDQPWNSYLRFVGEDDWRHGSLFATEGYEPIEALRRILCPFLAIYGGRDVLLPAWQGARDSGDALAHSGNPDATVVVFPNGDHRIRTQAGDFVPGYLDLMGGWAAERVR